jgi:hypothetical protein
MILYSIFCIVCVTYRPLVVVYRNDAIRPAYLITFRGNSEVVQKCSPFTELLRTIEDIEGSVNVLTEMVRTAAMFQNPRSSTSDSALSGSIGILGAALQLFGSALGNGNVETDNDCSSGEDDEADDYYCDGADDLDDDDYGSSCEADLFYSDDEDDSISFGF